MGNRTSIFNKHEIINERESICNVEEDTYCERGESNGWKPFNNGISLKNNGRPIRESYMDGIAVQTIIRYIYNYNNDEFNYNIYTPANIDEELLQLSILIARQPKEFMNLRAHPLFEQISEDLSMYISSKKNVPVMTPVVFKISPSCKIEPKIKSNILVDPLSDNLYHSIHKRFDRQEKQIRNIEYERFTYDRLYLEQKIDQLNGSNWKKVVMAISKITGCKDPLEIQRRYIVKRLEQVLKKFDSWKKLQLEHKKRAKKHIDLNKNSISKTNKTFFSKNHSKKRSNDENSEIASVVSEKINNDELNIDKHIQKKRKKSTSSSDSRDNNVIVPLSHTIPEEECNKSENISIKNEDTYIEDKNVQNEDTHIKNEDTPIKNGNIPICNGGIKVQKEETNKITCSTKNKKGSTFIKSPHIREAITNNWRRSSRTTLAFGQPLPKITAKVQEFSLPFEILEGSQK
ncbi:hypothetical protein T552_00423 [Pneumocystis carinii B80]|uniref:Something about silencing protein 4 domain-containing protein n=1 Tax=Pneumocystis carinii (strain B80) TaxID=1408658 RepID=A0A0W4ZQR3_PNEC8|nr:hypothetical protein T552_00423 [Pneumocystis carinii B80]KTW30711.1 hypothetical protein T552_00423 [Pneumocystis carinii B80]